MKASAAILAVWIAVLLGGAVPSIAQPVDGQGAFDNQDFALAEDLWRAEAAQGSAPAMLGLGLLRDLGLGGPRDPADALRWYLEAANLGLAEAQFNVGAMLDGGIGLARQPLASAAWYGRAAAGGNARASYNLGLLFAADDGIERNADLARLWLSQAAASLPAALARLQTLTPVDPDARVLSAPTPLGGGLVGAARPRAELVWAAGPAPEGVVFDVEIIHRPSGRAPASLVFAGQTQLSAIRIDLDRSDGQMAWRVFQMSADDGRYAAGPWQVLQDGGAVLSPPKGILQIRHAADDPSAGRFARDLLGAFDRAGYWTDIHADPDVAQQVSTVSHAFAQDAELAADIAAFLPGLSGGDVTPMPDGSASPGMVVLTIVGGPES